MAVKKSRPWRMRMYAVRVIGRGIVALFPADITDPQWVAEWARGHYFGQWFIQEVKVKVRDLVRIGSLNEAMAEFRDLQQSGFFGAV